MHAIVDDTRQLRNLVAGLDPGTAAALTIVRDGKERILPVTVGELADAGNRAATTGHDREEPTGRFGLVIEPLTDRQARALGFENESGVLVESVETDSPADEAGIHPGDLIVEVNRERVANVDEFNAAMQKTGGKVLLLIKTKEASRFVVLSAK